MTQEAGTHGGPSFQVWPSSSLPLLPLLLLLPTGIHTGQQTRFRSTGIHPKPPTTVSQNLQAGSELLNKVLVSSVGCPLTAVLSRGGGSSRNVGRWGSLEEWRGVERGVAAPPCRLSSCPLSPLTLPLEGRAGATGKGSESTSTLGCPEK